MLRRPPSALRRPHGLLCSGDHGRMDSRCPGEHGRMDSRCPSDPEADKCIGDRVRFGDAAKPGHAHRHQEERPADIPDRRWLPAPRTRNATTCGGAGGPPQDHSGATGASQAPGPQPSASARSGPHRVRPQKRYTGRPQKLTPPCRPWRQGADTATPATRERAAAVQAHCFVASGAA